MGDKTVTLAHPLRLCECVFLGRSFPVTGGGPELFGLAELAACSDPGREQCLCL